MSETAQSPGLARLLMRLATLLAYGGGVVVSAVGIMSAVSIVGRSVVGRPIVGDFELVEIGTAIAGSLFLPYCQATAGHIAVDVFTRRASVRTVDWLDRFGALLMAAMFLVVGWRTVVGAMSLRSSGETSMLMSFPLWLGYAGAVPGVIVAGIVALAQSAGVRLAGMRHE
jgi:TRAP-type C4-dicarboxylate transport system permease small subunit